MKCRICAQEFSENLTEEENESICPVCRGENIKNRRLMDADAIIAEVLRVFEKQGGSMEKLGEMAFDYAEKYK